MLHRSWIMVLRGMNGWHQGKLFIEHQVSFSHDSLHVVAGVFLWVAAGLLLRRSLTAWLPWLCVFLVITWNEMVDLALEHAPAGGFRYADSVKDLLLTMLIPTALMFAARMRPRLFQAQASARRRG